MYIAMLIGLMLVFPVASIVLEELAMTICECVAFAIPVS